MAVEITRDDLATFGIILTEDEAELLIRAALATARLSAPCLASVEPDSDVALAAKMVIIGAIARWATGGNNQGIESEGVGPFPVKYRTYSGKFSDSELAQLRSFCRSLTGGDDGGAFAIDTAPCTYPNPPFATTPLAQYERRNDDGGWGRFLTVDAPCIGGRL